MNRGSNLELVIAVLREKAFEAYQNQWLASIVIPVLDTGIHGTETE